MKKIIFCLAVISCFTNQVISQITFTNNSSLLSNNNLHSDHAIGVVDMNGDGKDDLVHTDNGDEIYYSFQGEPNGPFTTVFVTDIEITTSSSAFSWGLAVGDMDNNGVNELVTGGKYNGIYVIRENGGSYESEIFGFGDIFVQGINTFDFNNDGLLDIFSCDDVDLSDIYINDGSGDYELDYSFLNPVSDEPSDNSGNYGSVFTDIDNNGYFDLFIAKCRQGVQNSSDPRRINLAYMNDGITEWTSEGEDRNLDSGDQSWVGAFGDMDNDGDLDLIIGNHDVDSRLYVNDGTGNFTDGTEDAELDNVFNFFTIQGAWTDFDNDGFLDFIMSGGEECAIAMNDGDGTFTMDYSLVNVETNSFALGDLNRDGFIDIFTTSGGYGGGNNGDSDQILFNDGNENNFVSFQLVGTNSNANGIGTRITIEGAWGTQFRDVKSGQGYGIQNSLNQHFGLGTEDVIDQVTVSWPSGTVDTYTNVAGNSFNTITEGGDLIAGLNDQELTGQHLTLFPNPTTDFIEIKTNLTNAVDNIEIYDAVGKLIQVNSLITNSRVDVQSLATGNYPYTISKDKVVIFTGSFVKE